MKKRLGTGLIIGVFAIGAGVSLAGSVFAVKALGSPEEQAAIVTFFSTPKEERAVQALIKSVRQWGGTNRSCPIYVVAIDPKTLPGVSLRQDGVEVLALEMDPAFLSYPLAFKAFAAAQVEKRTKGSGSTLIWLDPGTMVLGPLDPLVLAGKYDAAVRPVTLTNTIAMASQTPPDEYWKPIYAETGLDYLKLPAVESIIESRKIQPYYNCESFSFNPNLGIAAEWASLLTGRLKDERYQKDVCTTSLRRLFLHQAVLSAVLTARIDSKRIKALPLAAGYPFSQHDRLPAGIKASRLNDVAVAIFDAAWDGDPGWMRTMTIDEPLKSWLAAVFEEYRRGLSSSES